MSLAAAKAAATHVYLMNGTSSSDEPDEVGTNDAAQTGGVTSVTGFFGGARRHEGTHYFTAGAVSGTGSFSLFAWVKRTGGSGAFRMAMGGERTNTAHSNATFYLGFSDANKPCVIIRNTDGSDIATATDSNAAPLDEWMLLMAAYDSSSGDVKLWVNGSHVATDTLTGTRDAISALRLGASWWAGSLDSPLYGDLDECGIIKDYVWSDSDATDLWNSGTGVSFSAWDAGGGGTFKAAWACYSNVIFCEV